MHVAMKRHCYEMLIINIPFPNLHDIRLTVRHSERIFLSIRMYCVPCTLKSMDTVTLLVDWPS